MGSKWAPKGILRSKGSKRAVLKGKRAKKRVGGHFWRVDFDQKRVQEMDKQGSFF